MKWMLGMLGMTIGGWIGWEVGSLVSLFTAFLIGIVGTAMGLYLANRFVAEYLP
ncbi:MAG: hypothetical protein WEG36_05960 [Gemmatimonadota bacterium]